MSVPQAEVVELLDANRPAPSPPAPLARSSVATPAELLRICIERDAPMEKIEKMLDLQERWEATQARKAFNAAMAKFRERQVKVVRSATVDQGPMKGTSYAKLNDFVEASAESLSSVGLSASWRITKQEKDWIEVACVIRHCEGHQEEYVMGGPIDTSGAKNAIQARASTVTYLEKYTLKMALGLAERDDDDDGNGGPGNEGHNGERGQQQKQQRPDPQPEFYPKGKFTENLPKWTKLIESGKKTAADIIATVESGGSKLTAEQRLEIESLAPAAGGAQ